MDKLDEVVKAYVRKVKDSSAEMLARLNADLDREDEDIEETERSAEHLAEVLADLQEELKATKRQRIRDIMKHPENEETLEETYDELENDLLHRIEGLNHQIAMTEDRRSTIIQVNRAAKTAMEVFDDILRKPKLERNDLELMIQRIKVYEDHIEIQLKADVDSILKSGTLPAETEDAANFNQGTENIENLLIQSSKNRGDKVFRVKVINNGSPSRMRMVRRISFGMTTRPRSSIRRTIPVAFISIQPFLPVFILCRRNSSCFRSGGTARPPAR